MNESDTPITPPGTAPDQAYLESALGKIRAAVKGNGVKADDIKVESFEPALITFNAHNTLTLRVKTFEKIVAGQVKGPVKVDNPQALRDLLEQEKNASFADQGAVEKIREAILLRKDKGFGVTGEVVDLPFLRREYVLYEPCSNCRAEGSLQCQRCHGQGFEKCPRCDGLGLERCTQCQGNGQIGAPQGGYMPCPRCQGQRKTPCNLCQQRRRIQCTVCKTKGKTICKQCNGLAWNSKITIAETAASLAFDYDRNAMPARVAAQVDTLGHALADHAQLSILPAAASPPGEGTIVMNYQAALPIADLVVSIRGVAEPFFIFGSQGIFINPPTFLETLMKRGLEQLKRASRGEGDATTNLGNAVRYKTLRHVVIAASRFSAAKAVKVVEKNTPLGLEREKIVELVTQAKDALDILTKKPRQTSMTAGTGVAIAMTAAYFLTPAYHRVATGMAKLGLKFLPELLGPALGLTLGYIVYSQLLGRARKDVMENLLKKKK